MTANVNYFEIGTEDPEGAQAFYGGLDDVAASLAQVQRLGASIAIPLTNNGAIEFAHVLDPQGNRFGIWRPLAPGA